MSKTLQFRRYPTSNLASITGAAGELIVDTTLNQITVHDGVTAGGWYAANAISLAANVASLLGIDATANANIALALSTANAAYSQANSAGAIKPQNAQSNNYVLQTSDAGKYIYYTNTSNVSLYIPTTANVAFSNGSIITVVSHTTTGNITIVPNTGVSLFAAGNSTSGSHNVTSYGVVTLMAAAANTWYVHGFGLN